MLALNVRTAIERDHARCRACSRGRMHDRSRAPARSACSCCRTRSDKNIVSEVMQRSWSARSSHVSARSVRPVIRSVVRCGVSSHRALPSACIGNPAVRRIDRSRDVLRLRGTSTLRRLQPDLVELPARRDRRRDVLERRGERVLLGVGRFSLGEERLVGQRGRAFERNRRLVRPHALKVRVAP